VTTPGLREWLQERAVTQARRFRWEDAAQTVLRCYEQALLSPRLQEVLEQRATPEWAVDSLPQAA